MVLSRSHSQNLSNYVEDAKFRFRLLMQAVHNHVTLHQSPQDLATATFSARNRRPRSGSAQRHSGTACLCEDQAHTPAVRDQKNNGHLPLLMIGMPSIPLKIRLNIIRHIYIYIHPGESWVIIVGSDEEFIVRNSSFLIETWQDWGRQFLPHFLWPLAVCLCTQHFARIEFYSDWPTNHQGSEDCHLAQHSPSAASCCFQICSVPKAQKKPEALKDIHFGKTHQRRSTKLFISEAWWCFRSNLGTWGKHTHLQHCEEHQSGKCLAFCWDHGPTKPGWKAKSKEKTCLTWKGRAVCSNPI